MKKRALFLLICYLVALALAVPASSEELESEKAYKPVDLVLVIDGSGSMLWSDPNRTAIDAGRMTVNMMPVEENRVGIISFNTKPTVHTKDTSGNDELISLSTFAGVETIRDALAAIEYSGDTGIGNALYSATQLLRDRSDSTHQRVIILFTDGMNDFGNDDLGLARCDENEVKALQWAKENDCPIYCVGYDYQMNSGGSSMGDGGEGIKKLTNIAESTGGDFQVIHDIFEMEQMLITFIADVFDVIYTPVATIPGDGGFHECVIPVSPSVIEANIRIAGGDTDAIANGRIRLYDPTGKEIALTNSGNVRFDTDATAASIKVIMPRAGDWLLTVDGINGDDIHVGLLEHFKMNLTSTLSFPEDNPVGVAYTNDTIGIRTWLSYDGKDLEDEAIYNAVTSAKAECVSRANSDENKTIELTRDGNSFVGSFVIPEDSYYDIYIRLDWDTVYREDQLTVMSSNKPVGLVRDIESVELNKGKTVTIDNIFQYVYDDENDPITAEVSSLTSPDVADVTIDGDTIVITGQKWSSTLATIVYRDQQGNTVESSFKITVRDPVAVAIIIGTIVLIVLAVLALMYFLYRRTFRIRGKIRVALIKQRELKDGRVVSEKVIFEDHNRTFRDKTRDISASKWDRYNDTPSDSPWDTGAGDSWGSPDIGSPWGADTGSPWGADTGSPWGADTGSPWGADTGSPWGADTGSSWGADAGDPWGADAGGSWGADTGSSWGADAGDPWGANPGGAGDPNAGSGRRNLEEEKRDDEQDRSFNSGEMELSSAAGRKDPNLSNVFNEFQQKYTSHMTAMGRESERAKKVEEIIKYNRAPFSEVKIGGSPRGRQGIVLKFPRKTPIVVESPRLVKNKISTKGNGRNPVLFKFSVPTGDRGEGDIYLEIEYVNN